MTATRFDIYDGRWRDAWVAATSMSCQRRRQIDTNIRAHVLCLLDDHGPNSCHPLTLRIYGTMIKGFCVVNNERARALHSDCERVVMMFSRRPFGEASKLPAKRQAREAALTLDLDLASVAQEAFDWTQAPLEEGALLRLGGVREAEPRVSISGERAPGFCQEGWLPRSGDGFSALPESTSILDGGQPPALMSQIMSMVVAPETGEVGVPVVEAEHRVPADHLVTSSANVGVASVCMRTVVTRRRREIIKPGVVYGFDDNTMLSNPQIEEWQADHADIMRSWVPPQHLAEHMRDELSFVEHLGPSLRILFDPPDACFLAKSLGGGGELQACVPVCDDAPASLPEVQSLLSHSGTLDPPVIDVPPDFPVVDGPLLAASNGTTTAPEEVGESVDNAAIQVGAIIRDCMWRRGVQSVALSDLVPPDCADRATAACTFSALLTLATAGEFIVRQTQPYDQIMVCERPSGASTTTTSWS